MHARTTAITRALATAALVIGLAANGFAQQGGQVRLDALDPLESRATKTVDVTLDENLIRMAMPMILKATAEDAEDKAKLERVKELVGGLRGVYVRSYEFDADNAYTQADVDAIRSQLRGPGWSRIAGVRSRKGGDNAEVHVLVEGGKMAGLVVLVAEPRELTVVNLVGTFDPEALNDLDGTFNIRGLHVEHDTKTTTDN